MISGGRYSKEFFGFFVFSDLIFTLQFFHEILSGSKTFTTPIGGFIHIFHGIKHKKSKEGNDEELMDESSYVVNSWVRSVRILSP
jgi:hypothetical protein